MVWFFADLRKTLLAGAVLAFFIIVLVVAVLGGNLTPDFWETLVRWGHVVCGVMWVGLIYYFSFVSHPTMLQLSADLRPALINHLTPRALFWYRWSAMGTIVLGIVLAQLSGYLLQAYTIDSIEGFTDPQSVIIGIGMWLGTIMWFNSWFILWPAQCKSLNIDGKFTHISAEEREIAAKVAGVSSRMNAMLSIPMLLCMVGGAHFFG